MHIIYNMLSKTNLRPASERRKIRFKIADVEQILKHKNLADVERLNNARSYKEW